MNSHYHNNDAGTQNQGNSLGNRSCIRQSKLFREYESGNKVKDILGLSNLTWKTNVNEGVYKNKPTYDMSSTKPSSISNDLKKSDLAGLYGLTNKHGNQSLTSSLPFNSSLAFQFKPDETLPLKTGHHGPSTKYGIPSQPQPQHNSHLRSMTGASATSSKSKRNISFMEQIGAGAGAAAAAAAAAHTVGNINSGVGGGDMLDMHRNKPFSPSGTGKSGGGFHHDYLPAIPDGMTVTNCNRNKADICASDSQWNMGSSPNPKHKKSHDPEVHNNYSSNNFDNYVDHSGPMRTRFQKAGGSTAATGSGSGTLRQHRLNSRHGAGYNIITGR